VGMFEHVGVDFYETYFRRCAELLTDDGVMMLHSIGRSEGPDVTNPWIAKYIFPGGHLPSLSDILPSIERAGLIVRGAGFGLIGNIVVGIIGALVASWLLPQLGVVIASGTLGAIIDATVGAVIVLVILSLIRRV